MSARRKAHGGPSFEALRLVLAGKWSGEVRIRRDDYTPAEAFLLANLAFLF